MKFHRLGGLNDRRVFAHRSGGWKSGSQHDQVLGEPSSWLATLSLCTHMAERERESKLSGVSSHHEGLALMTPISSNYFPKASPPNTTILAVTTSTSESGGKGRTQFSPSHTAFEAGSLHTQVHPDWPLCICRNPQWSLSLHSSC